MQSQNPRHYPGELEQMQSLPLDAKIRMTKMRIQQWAFTFGGEVYVSFSGGKDSTVLLHIARQLFPKMPAVFCDTGLEYPEIREFVKSVDNVTIIKPEITFRKVIEKYGYPVISKEASSHIHYGRKAKARGDMKMFRWYVYGERIDPKTGKHYTYHPLSALAKKVMESDIPVSDQCCAVLKKRPFKKFQKQYGLRPILGTMACESDLRYKAWLKHGCNAFDAKDPKSQPMSFWTEQDVLEYLYQYQIPYCRIYGDIEFDSENGLFHTTGCNRTGCMFCMFGCHRETSPNRFQRMKETHPQIYQYCMKSWDECGLGLDEVLTFIGVDH